MRILIADDHPLFRAGIRQVLLQLADNAVVDEAGDHVTVMSLLAQCGNYSLLLLDLAMPDMHGLALLETLTGKYPALPIVILSASESRDDMQRALNSGALGFVQKSSTPAVILSALRLVLSGGIYVPPALVQSVGAAPTSDRCDDLTPRQADVLSRVIEGKSNKAIANELGLTEATIKAHVTAVFKVLRVTNRMQAAIAAGKFTPAS